MRITVSTPVGSTQFPAPRPSLESLGMIVGSGRSGRGCTIGGRP
jgi:hypothetical protein